MQGKLLIGNDPVRLDFFFIEFLKQMAFISEGQFFNYHPQLVSYHKNVAILPKLETYIEGKTYTFNNKHTKINNRSNISDIQEAAYKKNLISWYILDIKK